MQLTPNKALVPIPTTLCRLAFEGEEAFMEKIATLQLARYAVQTMT